MCMKVNVTEKLEVKTDNEKEGWGCVGIQENDQMKHRMNERSHTLRAVLSYPAREALAGAIDGVAGAVVGTAADLSTRSPVPATWTDCET